MTYENYAYADVAYAYLAHKGQIISTIAFKHEVHSSYKKLSWLEGDCAEKSQNAKKPRVLGSRTIGPKFREKRCKERSTRRLHYVAV